MTHTDMEREVSARTGETLSTIRHRGFQIFEPLLPPQTVDWDALHAERVSLLPSRRGSAQLA